MSRAFLVGLILTLGSVLVGVVAAAAFEASSTGHVAVAKVSLMGATSACLVVLTGVLLTSGGAAPSTPHCHNCGTRLFATLRSQDRREVLTCFACGSEWAVPHRPSSAASALARP